VRYVSPAAVDYEQEAIEAREDAGTPGILQAIRCGIAFKVKEAVGCDRIEAAEQAHGRAALEAWRAHPQITLLGADRADYFDYERRVSIISFNIRAPEGIAPSRASAAFLHAFGGQPILHPHFVIQVLNDLYGIQGRSGCSCTGPYGHRLYGVAAPGDECAATMRHLAAEHGEHAAKLGWARVNL
jgi:selenocysteine lyase/cysteine desulfurase